MMLSAFMVFISCFVSDLDAGLLAGADAMAKPVPYGTSPELH